MRPWPGGHRNRLFYRGNAITQSDGANMAAGEVRATTAQPSAGGIAGGWCKFVAASPEIPPCVTCKPYGVLYLWGGVESIR